MNDRAVSVLEQYDIEVLRTWKGRGAILFETKQGTKILKEYLGPAEKLKLQNDLLIHMKEECDCFVEQLFPNKEGELFCQDQDQIKYIVKDYFVGKECNTRELEDCKLAVTNLATIHQAMLVPQLSEKYNLQAYSVCKEFEKRDKEIRKIRKFVKQKSQKNDFEIFLLNYFDRFVEQSEEVLQEISKRSFLEEESEIVKMGSICHGEYQHHNLVFEDGKVTTIHFEKCIADNQMRDLYLFMRKLMEKNNWSLSLANTLLEMYDKEKTIRETDKKQLYYRFSYPEKFWKIINFYYNTGKAWIPERNMEKLQKLLKQEEEKKLFIDTLLRE